MNLGECLVMVSQIRMETSHMCKFTWNKVNLFAFSFPFEVKLEFNQHQLDMLAASLQLAAETECKIDGYREFVSIYSLPRSAVMNADARFPYFSNAIYHYRLIRFRVSSSVIENGENAGPEDLADHQEIILPNLDAVVYILDLWQVPCQSLRSPRDVEIPV